MLHNILPKPPLQSKHLNIAKTKHTELDFHQPQQEWHKKKIYTKKHKSSFFGDGLYNFWSFPHLSVFRIWHSKLVSSNEFFSKKVIEFGTFNHKLLLVANQDVI